MQGTLQVSDTLATLAAAGNTTVAEYGIDEAFAVINQDNQIYNEQVKNELLPDFCVVSDQREWVYGGNDEMTVEEIDEYGDADVEEVGAGDTMGAPLRRYGRGVQWTWDYFQITPLSELAKQYTALQTADLKGIRRNIRNALLNPTNNLTYRDRLIDRKVIKTYALLNGDGMAIPMGPSGALSDASNRTHFLATASLVAADFRALIAKVLDFEVGGELVLIIPRTMETAIRAMTTAGDFSPLMDVSIVQPNTATYVAGGLDVFNPNDRRIGKFGAAWVDVRPWMPDNYALCVDKGTGDAKVLQFRTRPRGVWSDFGLRARTKGHPLTADALARDYGIAVRNRHQAAALYTGGGSYLAPSL
jgi:hypothetical protein